MNKKKIIVLISEMIIAILLTIYITSIVITGASYQIGTMIKIGNNYADKPLYTDTSNKVIANGAKNIINSANYNYFCGHNGVAFANKNEINYGLAIDYKDIAIVEINDDIASLLALEDWNSTKTYTGTKNEKLNNRALSLLFNEIKDGTVTVNGKGYSRTRSFNDHREFNYDIGQAAIWQALVDWRNQVALQLGNKEGALWPKVASFLQSETTIYTYVPKDVNLTQNESVYKNQQEKVFELGKDLWEEVKKKANNVIDNDYGIQQKYYGALSKNQIQTRIDSNGETILGPFKYNFAGSIENGKPTLTFDSSSTPQNYTIVVQNGSSYTTPSPEKVISGNEFYIKVKTANLANVSSIKLKFQVEGINLNKTTTTLHFFERSSDVESRQPIIYIEQDAQPYDEFVDTYEISKQVKINIVKLDANGNNLNGNDLEYPTEAGVRVRIKDSVGDIVARLEINKNGEAKIINEDDTVSNVGDVFLTTNETYIFTETNNPKYGYDTILNTSDIEFYDASTNKRLDNVTIEKYAGDKRSITFKFDKSSPSNIILKVKNTQELANLEIVKKNDSGKTLENIGFKIKVDTGKYLQITNQNGAVLNNISSATINANNVANSTQYHVNYVEEANATIFKTDSNGKILIKNLEVNESSKEYKSGATKHTYTYTIQEVSNTNYGYAATSLVERTTTLENGKTKTLTITNKQELGNLEIIKTDTNGKKLENVQFAIGITGQGGVTKYLNLRDEDNIDIGYVQGEVTINSNNIATTNGGKKEYFVEYIDNKKESTIFATNSEGKLSIKNLEVNQSPSTKYTYKIIEEYNINYGFSTVADTNFSSTGNKGLRSLQMLESGKTKTVTITNKQQLGNIQIVKYDTDNTNILLSNVGFVIQRVSENNGGYVALYNERGELVQEVTGTSEIASDNIATENKYHVEYVKNKEDATEFLTAQDGKLTVKNLEVCKYEELYTYRLIETRNDNYGYVVSSEEVKDIQLYYNNTPSVNTEFKTKTVEIKNKQVYTRVSGYVWLDQAEPTKSNSYDKIYTETDGADKKLTDLYIMDNGQLKWNAKAEIPVRVMLRNKDRIIKQQPDEFIAETGEYIFNDVETAELENYEIVFEYDGLYYTTTIASLDKDNGSKAQEDDIIRKGFNKLFQEVKAGDKIVDDGGKEYNVYYNCYYDEKTGTYSGTGFDGNLSDMQANTSEAKLEFKTLYNTIKNSTNAPVEMIDNINMGIVLREQPKISIGSDIHSVSVEVNGKNYDYYYNQRNSHYENLNGDEMGVKFEQEAGINRYTAAVYASDVKALENAQAEMKVSLIYKIKLMNQSSTLTSVIKEISNYFDGDYTIEVIGSTIDKVDITNPLTYEVVNENVEVSNKPNDDKTYKEARIKLGDSGLELKAGEKKDIYIKFSVSQDAIKGLLTGKSTYHNATEIMSYRTKYGENTGKTKDAAGNIDVFTSEQPAGKTTYAGIAKDVIPGNIELELIKDSRDEEGTLILNTENYEVDTTSAPSLLLEATDVRQISGKVWEDFTDLYDDGRYGNGILDDGESNVEKVLVELYNTDGTIAKYSNGADVTTYTDSNGNYTFGYQKPENGEYVGVLPGDYIIKFTYNNESYIVEKGENINVNDYKSTIIVSDDVEKAFTEDNNNRRWFIDEDTRYSNARDDYELRPEFNHDGEQTITNANYREFSINKMVAYTPIMDVGIECSKENLSNEPKETTLGNTTYKSYGNKRVHKIENVDFGIAERARINIEIKKEITGLEILAQNGVAIISKGDPTDINTKMQGVKKLDGLISAEIEPNLLQGAQLNLEYTITVINNSETDYLEGSYYYYGRIENASESATSSRVEQVVDYLDGVVSINEGQENWTNTTPEKLKEERLISEGVYKELINGDYKIITTTFNGGVGVGETKTEVLHVSKNLAATDSIRIENKVEIIKLTGRRTIEDSVPGDYLPTSGTTDPGMDTEEVGPSGGGTGDGTTGGTTIGIKGIDQAEVTFIITPPTGTTLNYMLYIIAGIVTAGILVVGIVIIKKKILK